MEEGQGGREDDALEQVGPYDPSPVQDVILRKIRMPA